MRVALAQIVSTPDPEENLRLVADGVRGAARAGAELVVFPEATMTCFGIPLHPVAEPLDGPWANEIRRLAAEARITIIVGMFTPTEDGRVTNTLLVTGGGLDTHYDKIHLYDAFGFTESRTVAAGEKPLVIRIGDTAVGVSTCYDIRFPGLYTHLAEQGATVLVTAASWGAGTGKREQWELLVRARALDSTSWLVACGQADPRSIGRQTNGKAPTGIGYSMVATPLGVPHTQLGSAPDLLVTDLDPEQVDAARTSVAALANRKF